MPYFKLSPNAIEVQKFLPSFLDYGYKCLYNNYNRKNGRNTDLYVLFLSLFLTLDNSDGVREFCPIRRMQPRRIARAGKATRDEASLDAASRTHRARRLMPHRVHSSRFRNASGRRFTRTAGAIISDDAVRLKTVYPRIEKSARPADEEGRSPARGEVQPLRRTEPLCARIFRVSFFPRSEINLIALRTVVRYSTLPADQTRVPRARNYTGIRTRKISSIPGREIRIIFRNA